MKYLVRVSSVSYAYAEVEIEAEDPETAEHMAYDMIADGTIELEQSDGEMDIDVDLADED